jgi:7-cyano-7-deazaguanine synthase
LSESSVVLLSSGLDSSVNFYEAMSRKNSKVLLCLTFNYGQRAAKKEIENAKKQCEFFGVAHKTIDLKWFSDFTNTSLVSSKMNIPTQVKIENLKASQESAKAVWVPNRNGIFLNIAAGFAEGLGADNILVGFNKEEAATFPDNSQEYLETLNAAFEYSTANKIKVMCYTTDMDKTQIAKRAKELNVNFDLVWPCYMGGEKICGECESCSRYTRALKKINQ